MTMTVERAFLIADDCGFEVCLRENEQDALITLAAEVRRLRAENAMLTEQRRRLMEGCKYAKRELAYAGRQQAHDCLCELINELDAKS